MVRNEILTLLAGQRGEFVSGETISQRLNITRAAIWKQIQALKEAGYEIEAMTKNGYRLLATPLSLDEWAVQNHLSTDRLGRKIYLYGELPSTNEQAKDLAKKGEEHGTVVISRRQTAGHGRMQRLWESPHGGLWMSVILKPQLSLADASKITLATSVAVVDAVREMLGLNVGIKWPNDIVYEGKKLVGILAEVVGEWTTVQTMIVGIGVNANIRREDLSPELAATSLREILEREFDLNLLAAQILNQLEQEVTGLEKGQFAFLRERWLERAVGIGKESVVQQGNKKYEGIFRGISADGQLVLQIGEENFSFSAGEVRLRARNGAYY